MDSNTYSLKKAMEILQNDTPLRKQNCGKLCNAKCCKGSDNDGMCLFPHEAELLKNQAGFKIAETHGNFGYPILVCNGECDRKYRPLACRFFPLFPLTLEHEGEIKVIAVPDPRAAMCPLLHSTENISKSFYRAVRIAGKYLVRDEQCRDYLLKLSEELTEIADMAAKL